MLQNSNAVQSLLNSPTMNFLLPVLRKEDNLNLPNPDQIKILESHKLIGWAYENIPAWREILKERRFFLIQKSMAQLAGLIKIKKAFEAANIDFIVLKGLPLSMLLYGDYTVRQCVDIDIFTSPNNAFKAHEGCATFFL